MVEYTFSLDSVFGSLADPTRRDILKRLSGKDLSVGEIAQPYEMSFAAVSKHLKILEKAKLVIKRRQGKQQIVQLSPAALKEAVVFMEYYQEMLQQRFDNLEEFLNQDYLNKED